MKIMGVRKIFSTPGKKGDRLFLSEEM